MHDPRQTLERLIETLVGGDYAGLERRLAPAIEFRGLAPGRLWTADSAKDAAAVFRTWFGELAGLKLLDFAVDQVQDRWRLGYRLSGEEDGQPFVVEQQAYCELGGGLVTWMHLVCSGFRAAGEAGEATAPREGVRVHRFDAGDLGCGTGLPAEFRRRVDALMPGEMLEVTTRDPAAREDLPALARLLGHRVIGTASAPDGSITITVESP